MFNIMRALRDLAERSGRVTVAQLARLHVRLWVFMGVVASVIMGGILLNAVLGQQWIALALVVPFATGTAVVWSRPLHFVALMGVGGVWGVVSKDETLASGLKDALAAYFELLKGALLVGVITLFLSGMMPISSYPKLLMGTIAAFAVCGVLMWVWPDRFKGTFFLDTVYAVAVAMIVIAFIAWPMLAIPDAWVYKYAPTWVQNLMPTTADNEAATFTKENAENVANAAAAEIRQIRRRLIAEGNRPATPAEIARVAELTGRGKNDPPAAAAAAPAAGAMPAPLHVTHGGWVTQLAVPPGQEGSFTRTLAEGDKVYGTGCAWVRGEFTNGFVTQVSLPLDTRVYPKGFDFQSSDPVRVTVGAKPDKECRVWKYQQT